MCLTVLAGGCPVQPVASEGAGPKCEPRFSSYSCSWGRRSQAAGKVSLLLLCPQASRPATRGRCGAVCPPARVLPEVWGHEEIEDPSPLSLSGRPPAGPAGGTGPGGGILGPPPSYSPSATKVVTVECLHPFTPSCFMSCLRDAALPPALPLPSPPPPPLSMSPLRSHRPSWCLIRTPAALASMAWPSPGGCVAAAAQGATGYSVGTATP